MKNEGNCDLSTIHFFLQSERKTKKKCLNRKIKTHNRKKSFELPDKKPQLPFLFFIPWQKKKLQDINSEGEKKSQQCKLGSARERVFLFLNRNSFLLIFLRLQIAINFIFYSVAETSFHLQTQKMCKQKKKMKIQYLSCIIDHTQVRRWRTENCIGWKKAPFIHNVTKESLTYCRGVE